MRTFCLGLLATTLALSVGTVAKQPSPMVVDGRVITGAGAEARPVRRARVTLSGKGLGAPRVTDTDAKGAYRFDRVPTGNYRISFSKPGFVRFETDAAPGATHTMARGGAIEGMVLDPGGVPLPGIMVNALQPQDGARPRLAANAYTDDLGRYRLHSLAAGDYVLEASSQDLSQQLLMPGEKRGTETRAYYPGVDTIESAKPVRVSAGREASGLDLRLAPPVPVVDPAAPPPPPRPDATGTARIAGRVTDAATGRPVNGARLLLVPLDGVALTNWKRSDAQGRFEYTRLEARRYRLTASADGLVQMEYGQKKPGEGGLAIQVKDGEDFKADMPLQRAGAVEGILFDEFGDGAPGVLVQVARKQFVAGRHRLLPIERRQNSNTTDDRGRYRVSGLEPGDYHVAALSGAYVNEGAVGGFARTYYPGTAEAGAATPVSVGSGADFATPATFALVPARTFTVAGRMIDQDGNLVGGRANVWLATPDSLKRMDFHLARGLVNPDGTFMLRNVPQGRYTLQGFGRPPADYRGPMNLSAMPFGWTSITVGDADLEDVVLKVTNGTTLRGKIVPDDSAAAPPAAQTVRVSTIPVEFDSAPVGGGPSPSETRDDLTFEVVKQSGLRLIRVSVSSPTWALKKIMLNDLDITDTPVDFRTRDVEGVEVILTAKVSHLSGVVSDDQGPVASYAVVIFASDPTRWTDRSRFVAVARPTQQGGFELRGLPPEDYLAVALPGVTGTEWMDPEFLQQLRVHATSFVLMEGESRTLSLKLKRRP